jgi:hypothetical protein
MSDGNLASAEAYYRAMSAKDLSEMARYLHPDVRLVTPIEELSGREAVLEAARRLLPLIQSIEVRAKFGSEDRRC